MQSYIDALSAASNQESLVGHFINEIIELGYVGFDAFSVDPATLGHLRRTGNWIVASYDFGTVQDYVDNGIGALCPLLADSSKGHLPFDYVAFLRAQNDCDTAQWQLKWIEQLWITHAWWVPLNTVGRLKGVTIYMRGDGEEAKAHFNTTRHDIHMRSVYFFQALEALGPTLPEDVVLDEDPRDHLTARERECLQWAAAGKTNSEIGVILGVSENTIRFHFKNVFRRLGVHSRTQAVSIFSQAANA